MLNVVEPMAAIDIGTNSTRLLVVRKSGAGWIELARRLAGTRLGEGIRGGVLLRPAMERTAGAVASFHREALELGARRVVAAATSAVRDAANREEFLTLVAAKSGLAVRVLSGGEEARLSCRGVLLGLDLDPGATIVVDVGGGSTELIWSEGGIQRLVSVNVGAVRLTGTGERDGWGDGLGAAIGPVLETVRRPRAGNLVGVGGTVTTLAAIDQKLVNYDPSLIHGYVLTLERIKSIHCLLAGLSLEDRKKVPGLQAARADIILAGVEIVLAVMEGLNAGSLVASESDLLAGLILEESGIK